MDELKALKDGQLNDAKDAIKRANAETASVLAIKQDFPLALKEAMEMQLEAAYRKNVEKAMAEMKRRIDYLQETEESQKRFKRELMLRWILKAVRTEIEENRNGIKQRYLDDCIKQLDVLAAKAN
uniref:ATP synthase subunit b n=1 Tax=Syphacia muris TaxID=451379 RepID=A0A0N5AB48_9BILA